MWFGLCGGDRIGLECHQIRIGRGIYVRGGYASTRLPKFQPPGCPTGTALDVPCGYCPVDTL